MKKLTIVIGLLLVICLLVPVSCTEPTPAPAPVPAPAPAPAPEPKPTPTPKPVPTPSPKTSEVPLSYEVVKSYIEEETYKERRRMVIGGKVIQDEIVEVSFPIGCVTLQNTDSVPGTFRVQFTFYVLRDKEFWGDRDETFIKMMGNEYSGYDKLNLDQSEMGIATYKVIAIDMDNDVWVWEYEVTPSTKTVIVEQ